MTVLRSLFLLLVLANLGLLAVFSWIVDAPRLRPAYDGPGITLLRETDPAAKGPAGNGAAAAAAVVDSEILAGQPGADPCISIGPFTLPGDADTAIEALTAAGFEPVLSTRETEVWDGYWVFIEAIENQAAARAIADDLAASGITDTQVIASPDRGTLLSLGVYSDISRAGTQAERVNRVGYEATIADSTRTTETHWLDVVLTSEESIALDLLREPGRISRLEQVACDAGQDD